MEGLTTGQVIDTLQVGQKAFVINHVGYRSHLVRVPKELDKDGIGGFEWRYTYPNGTKYTSWFSIEDEVLNLRWRIE